MRGFKSFARPTELTLEPGVTVIIGPNGSGKSNIADAVLWVLGEQSPGNLRGRTMQDVIFSGAGGRKSSAVAEVSLVFDNGSGASVGDGNGGAGGGASDSGADGDDSLPLGYEQLEVTRRLSRDTGSEYRLNGSGCRLLDVQDLVGGLGLGREMHSVISQGKVEALLNSTPEVRRAMVEEAAGLARFRKRRERAQAKLERTRQNLLRVGDIEREVKSALRPLRQQAAAAERFAAVTEEWALAKGRSVLHSLGEVRGSGAAIEEELERVRTRREELEAALAALRRQRVEEEEQFKAALEERESLSSTYHRVRAGAEYLEARAASLRQRLARAEGELDRARRRLDLARGEALSLASRVKEMTARTSDEGRLERVSGWAESLRAALEDSLPAYRKTVAEEDDRKDAVFELEAARSRALQDRDFLRREVEERSRVSAQLAALAAEEGARLEQLQAEADGIRAGVDEVEGLVRRAEQGVQSASAGRDEARSRAEEVSRTEAALGEELTGLESRLAVLADLLARREGTPAGARELLTAEEECRPLTELLRVQSGYERAVAAALGPLIDAVVLPAGSDLTRVFATDGPLEAIREASGLGAGASVAAAAGAGGAPAAETGGGSLPPSTRDLWDIVTGPEAVITVLRTLIPSTVVVEANSLAGVGPGAGTTRRTGLGWSGASGEPVTVVSRSGELLKGETFAARRQDVGAETLLRARNELETAIAERETLLARRDAVREAVEQAAAAVHAAGEGFRQREEELREAERRLAALKGEADLVARRLEEGRLQVVELQGRRERESAQAEQMQAELRAVEAAMAGREAGLEEARAGLRAHQAQVETLRRTVSRLEAKKAQAAMVEVKLRERVRAHESERGRVRGQWETAEREAAVCERRLGALDRYLPLLTRLLEAGEELAQRSRGAAASLESELETVRAATEGAARGMRDHGGAEAALQNELESLGARSTDLRVDQARLEDRRTLLEEELADLRHRHRSPRGLTPADVAGEDAAALEAAVERAERRREKIGPINPLAELECAEMEERAGFLAEQRRDLEASLTQLEDVIAELDEHIDRTFTEIFEAIREHFSAVIASVFPGAKGTLKLTETRSSKQKRSGNGFGPAGSGPSGAGPAGVGAAPGPGVPLEEGGPDDEDDERAEQAPGITLEVKFPNKSPRSLSLLSGGEKAMTAIAFLFSLFLARPCPFYILDEVEASLDDINIRRFLSLIRKYRDRTQFIIITHQRQTMEVADTLYGVTLESDGTSRVLSRRLATAKGA
jgi:chromosome segregation protein